MNTTAMTSQAVDLFEAYQRTGRLDLLNTAIELFGDAVTATPPEHPDRPLYLSDLGTALGTRFGRAGQLADLDEASPPGATRWPPPHPSTPTAPCTCPTSGARC